MGLRPVVISSWSANFGKLTEEELIQAAFHDNDISLHGRVAISISEDIIPYNEQILMGRHALNACFAIEKVMQRAQLWKERNLLRGKGHRFRNSRAAIIAGSSLGYISAIHTSQNVEKKFTHIRFQKSEEILSQRLLPFDLVLVLEILA